MARATCTFFMAGLLLSGCGRFTAEDEPGVDSQVQGIAYGDYLVGEPIRYQNLTVFPVLSPEPRADDRFITLDEGLKAGTVEIRELGGGAAPSPVPNAPGVPNPGRPAAQPAPQPPSPAAPPPAGVLPQIRSGAQGLRSQSPDPFADPTESPLPDAVPLRNTRSQQAEEGPSQERLQGAEAGQSQGQQTQGQEAAPSGGSGPSVNQVLVVNRSGKPLYLTPGDVMIGGQQDRVIGQEIVVEATGEPTTVPVFCVEHGRWARRDVAQNVNYLANVQANDSDKLSQEELKRLAEEANEGKFVKGAGVVTKDVRLAVQAAQGQATAQPKVWEEVAKANGKSGAQSGSGAFTANYGEKEIAEKLNPYLEGLEKPVAERRNVIGVIVAVNGKPHSIDVFESTPLFQKLWPKLLKSYALDAMGHGDEPEAEKTCDAATAVDFLKRASEARVANETEKAGVSLTHRENDTVACFTANFTAAKPALPTSGEPAPAKVAPIHLNALSK